MCLTQVDLAPREDTPSLAERYRQMAAGALGPGTPRGPALLGAALFKQCE